MEERSPQTVAEYRAKLEADKTAGALLPDEAAARTRTLALLGTLCGKLGVPARQESDLPQLYEALDSMLNFMREHPDGDE